MAAYLACTKSTGRGGDDGKKRTPGAREPGKGQRRFAWGLGRLSCKRDDGAVVQSMVVLLNQATTKFTEGSFQLTLALGDSWSHSCTNRLILYWKGNERCAYLDKSPSLPVASTPYAVTGKGVRDGDSSNCKRARIM